MVRLKYPSRRVLAVDVDGVLIDSYGRRNAEAADYARAMHADGWRIIVWSARGHEYAKDAAEDCGLSDLDRLTVCGKPAAVLDDQGWRWARWVPVITRQSVADVVNRWRQRHADQ